MTHDTAVFLGFGLVPIALGALLVFFFRKARRPGQKPAWYVLVGVNALVFLFLLSGLFLAGEIYFRFIYDQTDAFAVTRTSQDWFARHFQHNRLGLRDNIEYAMARPPGVRRLTFIGDSFSVGHGVKDVNRRFANLLRRELPEYEVHCMAKPGMDTASELLGVQQLQSVNYQFDVVVLVYCLNDIADILPAFTETLERVYEDEQKMGWFAKNSYLANFLHFRLKARKIRDMVDYYYLVKDAYRGPVWEAHKKRLLQMRDVVKGAQGQFCVVTLPFFNALGANYEYAAVHETLGSFWKEAGVPHLDLLPVYQGRTPAEMTVNRFDPHPNEAAHRLAAQAMLPFLRQMITNSAAP